MNKIDVQKRVLKNGEPLSCDLFQWDEKTKTFSSTEFGLTIDFVGIEGCTFTTRYDCTFKTESGCTFTVGGVTLDTPPLFFSGSRYGIGFIRPGWIKSGCIEKPVEWWKDNIVRCAKEHNYTPQQVKEYTLYVDFIVAWMELLGIDKEIEK